MQETHDEGPAGSPDGAGEAAGGVLSDSDEVAVRKEQVGEVVFAGGGWPIGFMHSRDVAMTHPMRMHIGGAALTWTRVDISALYMSPAVLLLVVEGMLLSQFFTSDVEIRMQDTAVCRGPYILLQGELSSIASPPQHLKNVILAADLAFDDGHPVNPALQYSTGREPAWGGHELRVKLFEAIRKKS
jgi:hypothetical protein